MHEIAYQKVEESSFFFKVWWDVAHQIWWDAFIKFDEMSFIRFDEISLIRFDEMSSVRFDEKSSSQAWWDRSYQVWWVAFVKFDESLSSSLMSRLVKFLSSRKIELDFVRHLEKIRVEQSKHKRWDDQAWSRERIHRNISARKNLKSHFSITFHISRQNATKQVTSIFATINIFSRISCSSQKRKMLNGSTPRVVGTGLPCPTQAFGGGGQVMQPYGTNLICGTARWRAAPGAHFFI
jgi:hypothetical protein